MGSAGQEMPQQRSGKQPCQAEGNYDASMQSSPIAPPAHSNNQLAASQQSVLQQRSTDLQGPANGRGKHEFSLVFGQNGAFHDF